MTRKRSSDDLQIAMLRLWCEHGLDALAGVREELDALNVYPVPDGDTGTNLYLTFEAACTALDESPAEAFGDVLRAFARGALLGARGNSGVILSQLLRAATEELGSGQHKRPGVLLADTLTRAAEAGYEAVGDPVEGTILTVARAAGDAARAALAGLPAQPFGQLGHVMRAAAGAAQEAVARTPEQLPILKDAGVVDAGGKGLSTLLDAGVAALTGRRPPPAAPRDDAIVPAAGPGADLSADGPGYEVMYLLDADDTAVIDLRRRLAQIGDSLVVVGGDGLWNVHLHVDDVGAALEAGIEAGHPHRVRVTHFADQQRRQRSAPRQTQAARQVVTSAAGPGLARLFTDAGAVVVHRRDARWSTGEVLDAIRATEAAEVVLLPNDADSIAAAEAAARMARDEGVRAAVIPTRAQVQGLAALAVRQPTAGFDDDVVAMTTAAGHTRHGAVTIAARDAMTMAGPCRQGDTLGIVEGDFASVGGELAAVAVEVVDRLLAGGGELVTLVTGADCADDLVDAVTDHLERTRPDVDLVVYDGGQPRYPLLIGVE